MTSTSFAPASRHCCRRIPTLRWSAPPNPEMPHWPSPAGSVRMPGRDGVSATAAITAEPALSRTRVIVLTTFDLDEYVHAALRAGASGFLLKDAQPANLLAAVHQV